MRLAKLELLAYGPFRGLVLDFRAPGLHVVFGRNEAGKSTTLRAITGLLYGIERSTPDAHVHKASDLRIGGVVLGANGEKLEIVRRKGNTNTLLDPNGGTIDEVQLKRLLGGVSEDAFKNAFGLDHPALGRGAQALLDGKGDLGESLFDASVGRGGDVQDLLKRLDAEADRLYTPRAEKRVVNEALKAFTAAQKAIKERQSLPDAYTAQEEALTQSEEEKRVLAEKKRALVTRRSELERARVRVPLERRRDRLRASIADLGPLAAETARIEALRGRVELYERSLDDRKKLAAEVLRLSESITQAVRRAGIERAPTDDVLDVRKDKRATALVNDRTRLLASIAARKTEVARIEREMARLQQPPAVKAASKVDGASLDRTLPVAVGLGDAEARLASDKSANDRRRKELGAKLSGLGLFQGSLDDLVRLRVPASATIDDLAARATEADKKTTRSEERLATLDAEIAQVERQIAEHSGDLAPPDVATLRSARDQRDEAYAALTKANAKDYERLVKEADSIADRMLREADRVATLARHRSMQETATRQRNALVNELAAHQAARAAIDELHRAAFAPANIIPLGFAEMRAWLTKREQIVDAASSLEAAEARVAEEEARIANAKVELARVLDLPETTSLSALVAAGTREAKAIVEAHLATEEARRTLAKRETELDERAQLLHDEEAELEEVRAKLAEILRPLGIAEDASPEEIKGAIDALRDVFDLEAQRTDKAMRAEAAEAEVREIESDVRAVAETVAPDLAGRSAREVVIALCERASTATKLKNDLETTEADLAELSDAPIAEELVALAADPDAGQTALEELIEEIDASEREVSRLDQHIGSLRSGLDAWSLDSKAAEAATQREEALARLRDGVERWCRVKLAATVLAREIERYREENEGPLVAGAAKLFARLTLGAFSGVRSGFNDKDDKPCLRCVRSSGAEVDISGLSEGTRDQLYLSLRLATLLRRADVADPMPLVLDDVLIQLDDERAGAALVVLAEVAKKMQVLFFTHHARLVELARRNVPKDELVVHDLDAVSKQGSLFASAP